MDQSWHGTNKLMTFLSSTYTTSSYLVRLLPGTQLLVLVFHHHHYNYNYTTNYNYYHPFETHLRCDIIQGSYVVGVETLADRRHQVKLPVLLVVPNRVRHVVRIES